MNNKIMENILEEKYLKRKSGFLINDMNISSTDIAQERINHYNKNRKTKINSELYNKESNTKGKSKNNSAEKNSSLNISNLNIDQEMKNENFIKELLNEDNIDKIMGFININLNIDYIKYGLYLLNEKINLNLVKDINILRKYNFNEIFYSLLIYAKNESTKINFDSIIIKMIYDLIIKYIKIINNGDYSSFLCNEKYFELHLFFIDNESNINTIKNILECIQIIVLGDSNKLICKVFEYNDKTFFNKLIEIINDHQTNKEICETILKLFILYINQFNDFKKIKSKKSKEIEIEMKDNTYHSNNDILETIYNISLILISNKHFDNSLYLICNIIKIIYKTKNLELLDKIISNNNNFVMLNFILEKDYSECVNNIIYIADIIKYLIKLGWVKNKVKELIIRVDNTLYENNSILNIFINLLLNTNLKLKEKISIHLINAIYTLIKNEININEDDKYNLYKIITKYIKSSNYNIRKKTMKILEKLIINKKDYAQADYLIKNKILYFIKQAIDPSVTYCTDEKLILMALNVIDYLLSLGESIKILNGVNTVLDEFENIGGKEMLDNLLSNKSKFVFDYASHLIDKYFN